MVENKPWLCDVIQCPSCQSKLFLEKLSNGKCENCGLGYTKEEGIVTFYNQEVNGQLNKEVHVNGIITDLSAVQEIE